MGTAQIGELFHEIWMYRGRWAVGVLVVNVAGHEETAGL